MLYLFALYFIWGPDPRLFSIGSVVIKWNAVLLIVGFLICRQILFYVFSKEKKPLSEAARLSIYLIFAALIGSRLGHLLFYEPQSLWSKVLTIVFPFEWEPAFNVLSMDEFSVHGAAIGVLIFLFFYKGKRRLQYNLLQVVDRVVLPASAAGVVLMMSSFLSSDIVGRETVSSMGTVFILPVVDGLSKVPCCIMRSPDGQNPLENVIAKKAPIPSTAKTSRRPVILYLFFKAGLSEQLVNEFLVGDVKTFLYDMSKYVHEPGTQPLRYRIFLDTNGKYIARISTLGIARYPVQLFEAVALLILFCFLFWSWLKSYRHLSPGRLTGFFMVIFATLHLLFHQLKVSDASSLFDTGIQIGLIADLLFILAGIVTLVISRRKMPVFEV